MALPLKGYVYHPEVARGDCIRGPYAPNDQRYVGLFHWSSYWHQWDKVIAVDEHNWTVQAVDFDGNPKLGTEGRVRVHGTPMEASHFADRPFYPRSVYDKDAILYSAQLPKA